MAIEIRRGDHWRYLTNTGYLMRHVRSVACGVVYYISSDGDMCKCSLAAFRRWIGKHGELWSADDWTGRETKRSSRVAELVRVKEQADA